MAELKIMFWNIQNVYDFKIVTPAELVLEESIRGEPEMGAEKLKKLKENSIKLFQTHGIEHREHVASIIGAVNPDIVAIVEFSVGKADLELTGTVPQGMGKTVVNALVEFDHWGARQYQVSLNDHYKETLKLDRWWASSMSPVNCSDIIANLKNERKVEKIEHSNSMFELYGLLWDTRKVELVGDFAIDNLGPDGSLHFPQRSPGVAWFKDKGSGRQFLLVMIHSVFGEGTAEEVRKLRSKPIRAISQLNVVQQAVKRFNPMAVAGDFNLDFSKNKASFDPLLEDIKFRARIEGKTSLGKPAIRSKGAYVRNAYDNIFTLNFANDTAKGEIKDFVRDEFRVRAPGDSGWDEDALQKIENALKVSDHLPVFATLRF